MHQILRSVFAPLLSVFESGEGEFNYKPSFRVILIAIGCLFGFLASVVSYIGITQSQVGAIIPAAIFAGVAITALVVGGLGSDRGVAKIWGNR